MKKKNNLISGMLALTAALAIGLTGCGNMAYTGDAQTKTAQGNFVLSDVMDAVTLPNQYLVSYEIQSADGIITSMTKGVDASGNVYFADNSGEVLYVAENGRYLFADDLESEHAKAYTSTYVEQITAPFMEYAEKSKMLFSGAANLIGNTEIAGRSCKTYEVSVTFANFTQSYEFAVDEETGVCLSWQADKTISGHHSDSDQISFVCTKFIVNDVKFPVSANISNVVPNGNQINNSQTKQN